jgi:thymidylate synthase (FAD)
MKVTVEAITQPLIKIPTHGDLVVERCMTPNEYIAYAARISNPDNQMNTETAPKLLKYLYNHRHWSPFQMISANIKIQTTRDISHQIIRHWSFDDVGNANLQEFSQRYAQATGFEIRECRIQDAKNRQNSIESSNNWLSEWWVTEQQIIIDKAKFAYDTALRLGIAKEQARAILPEGLTQTTFIMAGTMRSWIHYCQIRSQNDVQKEHRLIARECWTRLLEHFPDLEGLVTW